MLIQNKTSNKFPHNAQQKLEMGSLSAISIPVMATQDSASIAFGSGPKNKPTKTWKQYFSDLFNKVRDQIRKFIDSVKSFFKKSPKNPGDPKQTKDTLDSTVSTNANHSIDSPAVVDFSKMTPEETTIKVKQLIEHAKKGKTHNDLAIEDQCFLGEFIREALKRPDSETVELGKGLAELFGISIENTKKTL